MGCRRFVDAPLEPVAGASGSALVMAQTYRQQYLAVLAQTERDMTTLFDGLHARITTLIGREALFGGGVVPPAQGQTLRARVGRDVQDMFLRQTADGLQSFQVVAGEVRPLSPYMIALWRGVEAATRIAVEQHAALMRRYLRRYPDVLAGLEQARRNPFAYAKQVQEQEWDKRPFVAYDPLHRFVRPDGYNLSDRIWQTAGQTRRKLDLLLADQIAEGKGSLEMARELEIFLKPGRQIVRTNKPYGTNASYDAMRLARTEISAATHRAGIMAAQLNPFVTGYYVRRASSRPCNGDCDEVAAGGPYALTDMDHLPPRHPHCMCYTLWATVDNPAAVVGDLRDELAQTPGVPVATRRPVFVDIVGPLLVGQFVRWLLGEPETLPEYV